MHPNPSKYIPTHYKCIQNGSKMDPNGQLLLAQHLSWIGSKASQPLQSRVGCSGRALNPKGAGPVPKACTQISFNNERKIKIYQNHQNLKNAMGNHIQPEFFVLFFFPLCAISSYPAPYRPRWPLGRPNAPISWLLGAGRRADSSRLEAAQVGIEPWK